MIMIVKLRSGYYPVFSFLSSLNGLIDLASMGLIGQKGMLPSFELCVITDSKLDSPLPSISNCERSSTSSAGP
jgi:hypothetical protein